MKCEIGGNTFETRKLSVCMIETLIVSLEAASA